jgi:hypothetical protein
MGRAFALLGATVRRSTRTGCLWILVIGTGLGLFWAMKVTRGLAPEDELVISKEALDLGRVWEDEAFHCTLPIENRSRHEITIARFAVSCDCAKVSPSSLTIQPGAIGQVELTIDLGKTARVYPELTAWEFSLRVTPAVEGCETLHSGWLVRGTVLQSISVDPVALEFGEEIIRNNPTSPKLARLLPKFPAESLSVEYDRRLGQVVTRSGGQGGDGQGWTVEVTPNSSQATGPLSYEITLVVKPAQSLREVRKTLAVKGQIVEDVRSIPDRIVMAARNIGDEVEETVLLASRTNKSFTIEAVEADSRVTRVMRQNPQDVRGKTYRITQRITTRGSSSAQIAFKVRLEGQDELIGITLPIVYYGLASD